MIDQWTETRIRVWCYATSTVAVSVPQALDFPRRSIPYIRDPTTASLPLVVEDEGKGFDSVPRSDAISECPRSRRIRTGVNRAPIETTIRLTMPTDTSITRSFEKTRRTNLQGLFYLLTLIAFGVVAAWVIQNENLAPGEYTIGLLRLKNAVSIKTNPLPRQAQGRLDH